MRNLINTGIESLVDSHPEYQERSRIGHAMKDAVLPGLTQMAKDKKNCSYKALVAALFESGFLSAKETCFNTEMLLNYIYGAKMHESIETLNKLFDVLTERGATKADRKTMYNPSGDNYYCALQFQIKPTEENLKTAEIVANIAGTSVEEESHFRSDIYRKVIVIENQSPQYAAILDHSIYSGQPEKLHFVQLKRNYNDVDYIHELIDLEFDIGDMQEFSAYGNEERLPRIITTLDVDDMECKPVLAPRRIEFMLYNLYSALESIQDE